MMKFQILAPAWRADSAGVRYLWALGHQLEQLGHTVTMLNIAQSHAAAAPDTVVIYPEIVTGNPLMAQRVVRYYLNKEGMAMGNPVLPEAQDFVLTFFPHYHPEPHYNLKVFFDLEDFWHNDHVPSLLRTQDCCLIGKGRFYTHCTVPQGAREISHNRPVPRSELPQLLAQTRLLYTWDSNSGMCIEAVLSGCLVVILQYYPLTTDQIFYPTVTVQDGQIIVPHDYDQQRLLWRQQLMQTNENYAQNVQTLVQKLEAHWG